MQRLVTIALVMVAFASCWTTASSTTSRVKLGYSSSTFSTIKQYQYYGADDITVSAMQKDRLGTGEILTTVGNAVYSIGKYGSKTLLAGHLTDAGFQNSHKDFARFNKTAGLAQIGNGKSVLIADTNNRCIRKLNRVTNSVSTYAGTCGAKTVSSYSYKSWKTFNSPSSMRYVKETNTVYVLDEINGASIIVSKNLTTGATAIIRNIGQNVKDFVVDAATSSFVVTTSSSVHNISKTGIKTAITSATLLAPHGLAYSDGILAITDTSSNVIKVVDTLRNNKYLYTLCSSGWNNDGPSCSLTNPTAVAIFDGYLYMSTSNSYYSYDSTEVSIKRMSFTITSFDDFNKPTTTYSYNNDGDYSSSYSGMSGGVIAAVVIVAILVVAGKIGCIVCCVYRWSNRWGHRNHCHTGTTIVAVQSTNTTVPYGRLQETYNMPPASGQFPAPPAYNQGAPPTYAPQPQPPVNRY